MVEVKGDALKWRQEWGKWGREEREEEKDEEEGEVSQIQEQCVLGPASGGQ